MQETPGVALVEPPGEEAELAGAAPYLPQFTEPVLLMPVVLEGVDDGVHASQHRLTGLSPGALPFLGSDEAEAVRRVDGKIQCSAARDLPRTRGSTR